jgi:hypothetical protein
MTQGANEEMGNFHSPPETPLKQTCFSPRRLEDSKGKAAGFVSSSLRGFLALPQLGRFHESTYVSQKRVAKWKKLRQFGK